MTLSELIPEVTSNFNAYNEGRLLGGVSNELDLPELEADTDEIRGAGIMGGWNAPAVGQFGPTTCTIPFINVCESAFKLMDSSKVQIITLRASVQYMNPQTMNVQNEGVVVTLGGRVTKASLGKFAVGAKGETELEMDLTYIEVKIGKKVMFKLNKTGNECIVNGKDIYATVRSQI